MPVNTSRRLFLAQASAAAMGEGKQKIVAVKAAPLRLLPASRFGTKKFTSDYDPARFRWFGPFSQLTGAILVRIRTDQGLTGYGMGGGGTAAVHVIEHHLQDLLLGANALNVELLWEQMFASTSFYGRRGLPVMAISGIDLALWDIAGQAAGVPVWRMLGGAVKERIPAYYTGSNFERAVKLGFRAFKMGMFEAGGGTDRESMRRLIEALERARSIVGAEAKLMLDCLCRWNVEHTLEFARRAEHLNLYFIEEPLPPDDVVGYQRLCREVKGPRIACGEHEFTHYGFAEILRNRAAQILQPDLTWGGGLSTIRKVAEMGAREGVPLLPHRGGSLFAIHLAASHANCLMAESFGTGEGNEMMERLTAPFENGYYLPPRKAGLGVELPEAVLRKHVPELAG